MAMLLAMFQKMRLIRERNQLVLEQTQYSSKLTRVQKNSKRIQEIFASKQKKLENQASRMQKNATLMFQNMFNLGANCVNPYNYSGMNGFIQNAMLQVLGPDSKGLQVGEDEFKKLSDSTTIQKMLEYYSQHGHFNDKDGKLAEGFTKEDVELFNQVKFQAQQMQQERQWQCQQLSQGYGENVSIWLENQQAQLEAEQDEMLAPLSYEETMLELQKELTEQRLARIKTEIESYDQLCKDEVQNSAPKFGLG